MWQKDPLGEEVSDAPVAAENWLQSGNGSAFRNAFVQLDV